MKKRCFSLIEVLVSLGLISLLLSTLFFWYHALSKQKEEARQLKAPLREERYAQQRLRSLWQKVKLPFFSSETGCVFFFDQGATAFPELSGTVLGRLYYDQENHRLCLGIWPAPDKDACRSSPSCALVLLDRVTECTFCYYHPPDPFKQPVNPEEVGHVRPQEGWQDRWEAAYKTFPALVSVHITRERYHGLDPQKLEYCFDLPVKILYARETKL